MLTNKRIIGVDALRVMAIAMIVLAHIVVTVYQRSDFFGGSAWTTAFIIITLSRLGVPIFFMISGYLLFSKDRTFLENINHTWKRLGVPFIFWSGVTYIGLFITHNLPKLNLNLFLSGGGTEYYFLIGLAVIYVLSPFIRIIFEKTTQNQIKFLLLVLGLSTIGQIGATFLYQTPQFTIFNYWLLGLFYFMYGSYIRKYKNNISSAQNFLLFLLPLLINLVVIYMTRLEGNFGDLYVESYFGPTVLLSAIGLFNFIMNLNLTKITDKFKTMLISLSSLSFGVFLIHGIVLDLLLHKSVVNPYGKVTINLWVFLFVATVFVFSVSLLLAYIFRKNKLGRIVLGE